MSAPPPKRRVVNCQNKVRYSDELAARTGALTAIERFHNTDALYVYRCPECSGWHLTRTRQPQLGVTEGDPFSEKARPRTR